MFDVLDILLPALSTNGLIEVRHRDSAFGKSDDAVAYYDGVRLGDVLPQQLVSGAVTWPDSESHARWTVLLAGSTANTASTSDETWQQFLNAFVATLKLHNDWRVRCESDCDQHVLRSLELTPDELGRILDTHRAQPSAPLAWRVQPSAASQRK
jgi:hypothetical protein